jgi:zinc protease
MNVNRNRILGLAVLLMGGLLLASPAHAAKTYDYQKRVLDNGLTVITLEDHSCPVVAVQLWYHVGSKNENPERQGFAHMFEHMMFRGTEQLDAEAHFDNIRRTGGTCNAYTAFDNTTYTNKVPANQLELVLWLEAERMAYLKIDEEGFYTERNVVEEERRMRTLNAPYGTVMEKVLRALFKEHPYRWSPIGQIPHLRAATIDELQAFWDKYYVPANATLVMVGDFKHEDAQKLAEKYFGWIPRMPAPPALRVAEPPQTEPQQLTIEEKKGPVPIQGIVYRTVPMTHKDALPLQVLMSILGGGESSRLYQDIVKERKLAQMAMAGAMSMEDHGVAGAGVVMMPWGNKKKALAAVREHIDRIKQEGVTWRELEKAKNQLLRSTVTQSLTVESKASLLGSYAVLEKDVDKVNKQLDEIRSVSQADVKRVANTYLVPEHETEIHVQPKFGSMIKNMFGGAKEEDPYEGMGKAPKPETNRVAKRGGLRANLARPSWMSKTPPVAPVSDKYTGPVVERARLNNGLQIVVIPNDEVPFVTMTLGIRHGAWSEDKPGTASLAAAMITKGTKEHSAKELAEELEYQAISLNGSAGRDVSSVNASCVKDNFDHAIQLLSEVVRMPTFPEDELQVMREQLLMGLMVEAKSPEYLANRELRQRLFGDHPYARSVSGEPEDVKALTSVDLEKWWTTFARPDQSVLYVAGDVDPAQVMMAVQRNFSEWVAEGEAPELTVPPIPEPQDTHIYLVDLPTAVQAQVRVGHVGPTRQDKQYFAGRLMSQIFGGAFNSRLNRAIRVERGLTYGARGGFSANKFAGQFQISTFTKPDSVAEAINVILAEIDKIRSSPVEKEELNVARSYAVGSFAGDRETPQATVGDLWLIEYADLRTDFFQQYMKAMKELTADDLLSAAQKLIHRDKLTIVVVGKAEELKLALESIAPVTVVKPSDGGASQSKPAA